jgi:RNA polymerase sigma factor (sigma-70 family)
MASMPHEDLQQNVPDDPPITAWLRQLESGQNDAATPLWKYFCERLMQLASKQLNEKLRPAYDAEDAAISAFHSMCRVISTDRQSDLSNRENLWRLLVVITERKVIKRIKYETRDKRDVRRTLAQSDRHQQSSSTAGWELISHEPSPEFASEFAEVCGSLLDELPDETMKRIVQLRLTDHTNAEIAEKLGITRRTVERKLLVIRARWLRIAQEEAPS